MLMTQNHQDIHVSAMTVKYQNLNAANEIKLNDAKLELLGNYYTDEKIAERTLFDFNDFLELYLMGRWHERVI